jgi:hypothetical protein
LKKLNLKAENLLQNKGRYDIQNITYDTQRVGYDNYSCSFAVVMLLDAPVNVEVIYFKF